MNVLGVDCSYYQRPPLPWAAWAAFGVERAYIRASIGYLMDWAYSPHREQARAAGLATGAYHALLDHDTEITQFDPAQAARSFVSLLHPDDELPAVVDVEALGVDDALLWAWITEYERLTDRPLMIYTSAYMWHTLIGRGKTRYSRFPFWVADYDAKPPRLPDIATQVAGHQFRFQKGYLPGYAGDLDVNEWYDEVPMPVTIDYLIKVSDRLTTGTVRARLLTAFGEDLLDSGVVAPFNAANNEPAPIYPPVGPPEHTLADKTNQAVINLFNTAFGPNAYIAKLTAATDEATLFSKRAALYVGPPIETMPGLTDAEKARLIAALT